VTVCSHHFQFPTVFDCFKQGRWKPPGLVALDNRIGHDGTVWGEDFVLSDLSALFLIVLWSKNVPNIREIIPKWPGRGGTFLEVNSGLNSG